LGYQELHARIREEGILTNLKQENTALWTKLKEVEENTQTVDKKVMKILENFLTSKTSFDDWLDDG
jgi:hypothetical protein